jgi:superfamily I DNA/RNA helicase
VLSRITQSQHLESRVDKLNYLINLITLHSSKGLEFQVVIMVGVEEGLIPHANAKSQREIDEARRLFYVGVTRAKTEVRLLYDRVPSPLITKIRSSVQLRSPTEGTA